MDVVLYWLEKRMDSQSIRWDRIVNFQFISYFIDYIFIIAFLALSVLLVLLILSMKDHLSTVWFVILCVSGVVFVFSYLNIGLSVPGFASKAREPSQEDKLHPKYCKPCKIVRTNDVYHCLDCDVCIEGYDHHCPWIGKCVGRNNLKSFYFFLFMTFGTLIMTFIATLGSQDFNRGNKNLRTDKK